MEEVKKARDQALADLKAKNLDGVDVEKIKVDVPVAGPSRPPVPAPAPRPWLEAPVLPPRLPINQPAPRVAPVAPQPAPIPVLPHYRDAFGAMDPYFDASKLVRLPPIAYPPLFPPQAPLQLPPAMAPPIVQPAVAPPPVHARARKRRRRDYWVP